MLLMIDNYDSFTYNVVQYLGELGADVKVVRNDELSVAEIEALNPERIVVSPGPCTPTEAGVSIEAILHFAGKLTETDAAAVAAHFTLTGAGNPTLTATLTDGGKGVMLTPTAKLAENQTYSLSWSNLTGADGAIKPVPLSFSTRPANTGARNVLTMAGATSPFTVASTIEPLEPVASSASIKPSR